MHTRLLAVLLALCIAKPVRPSTRVAPPADQLSLAITHLYNARFDLSRQTLSAYTTVHPADPLAYSLMAASYLFSDLDRSGALQKDVFSDAHIRPAANDPSAQPTKGALGETIKKARELSQAALRQNPTDENTLLAMVIVSGVQRDYLALVERRYRESYEYIKESQGYASRLLKINPSAYDAYFTQGFTEYLIGSMPFFLRWFMKMDDIVCTKEQGLQDLRVAADQGQYLKPFAQILLAMFYLREKQELKTEKLLTQLTNEYPENKTFRRELEKVRAQNHAD